MMTRFSIFLAMLVGFVHAADAGGVKRTPKRHVMDEGTAVSRSAKSSGPSISSGGLTWVLVDTMQNAYGMLSNRVDPLAYDPVSGYVALIHRGKTSYAAGSGELWYNTSPDGVTGWARIAAINCGAPILSRYPSAMIASGGGAGSELFAYSAPQLNPGAFGYVIYGVDPLNAGVPFCVEDQGGPFWSNTRITAADDFLHVWWAASYDPNVLNAANAAVHVWHTGDYGTIHETDVWDLSLFQTRGLEIGLCYRNGTVYLGGYASLVGDPNEVMNVFYSKSTDNGSTWSAPDGPNIGVGDWRTLPGLSGTPYTDWHVGESFDMLVDAEGLVHLFGVVVDSVDDPNEIAIIEIFETGSGWEADIISDDVATTTRTDYGGVDQMGFHVNASVSPDGEVLAVFWLAAPQEGDSLPDIFLSLKGYSNQEWYYSLNISETPDFAELLLQVAPIFEYNVDGGLLAYVASGYESGTNAYPPDPLLSTDIFVAPVIWFINDVTDPTLAADEYRLNQNYPNPFNAQTRISYTVGSRKSVVLKIYDVLGREVVTLVNETKEAGTHSIAWDAAGQSSGVYYYRMLAGGYMETRRLVLIK